MADDYEVTMTMRVSVTDWDAATAAARQYLELVVRERHAALAEGAQGVPEDVAAAVETALTSPEREKIVVSSAVGQAARAMTGTPVGLAPTILVTKVSADAVGQ